jgi:hypothetical protein
LNLQEITITCQKNFYENYNFSSMKGCNGAHPGSYIEYLASKGGEAPHENEYPYLYKEPKLTCPLDAKIFNTGAKVTKGSKDYKCNEDKMKQLVIILITQI